MTVRRPSIQEKSARLAARRARLADRLRPRRASPNPAPSEGAKAVITTLLDIALTRLGKRLTVPKGYHAVFTVLERARGTKADLQVISTATLRDALGLSLEGADDSQTREAEHRMGVTDGESEKIFIVYTDIDRNEYHAVYSLSWTTVAN